MRFYSIKLSKRLKPSSLERIDRGTRMAFFIMLVVDIRNENHLKYWNWYDMLFIYLLRIRSVADSSDLFISLSSIGLGESGPIT